MIDFTIPDEYKELGLRFRRFVHEHCVPVEAEIGKRPGIFVGACPQISD